MLRQVNLKWMGIFLFFLCTLASCSKDDEPSGISGTSSLVGTWICHEETVYDYDTYTMTLSANNTGKIVNTWGTKAEITLSEEFTWTTSESSSGNKYIDIIHKSGDFIVTDEESPSVSYVYVVAADQLSFGGLVFKKK